MDFDMAENYDKVNETEEPAEQDRNEDSGRENGFDDKSGSQMLAEVGRLLVLLLGKLLRLLWRLLLRGLKQLLKWAAKGLLLLIDGIISVSERIQAFWNDNSTQEKLCKTKLWTIRAGKQLCLWMVMAVIGFWTGLLWLGHHTWKATVWLSKKTVQGIIHLGPTLRAIGLALRQVALAVGRWFYAVWRGLRKWAAGRKRAYRHFRRNKGFKGLLIDIADWLKGQIRDYVDEAPVQQPVPDDVMADDEDEDDPFKLLDAKTAHSKVNTWGRTFYNALKQIVED